MSLPTDARERKEIPLFTGLFKYFPDALCAVAHLSFVGNKQHNPGQPLHWAREKSTDQEDTILRHMMESGKLDVDGVRHSVKVAWRALAMAQLEIEASRGKSTPESANNEDTFPQLEFVPSVIDPALSALSKQDWEHLDFVNNILRDYPDARIFISHNYWDPLECDKYTVGVRYKTAAGQDLGYSFVVRTEVRRKENGQRPTVQTTGAINSVPFVYSGEPCSAIQPEQRSLFNSDSD